MRARFLRSLATVSLGALLSGTALAAIFPDVPDGHLYKEAIEGLVAGQVVKGNPDGTFHPEREVNRAEMLMMLYRAKGMVPDSSRTLCFPDVLPGSWYEAVVCDAAARNYVSGYADGTFHPAQPVNRVEALKMIATIFDLNVENISEEDRQVVKFVDVSTAAWYTKYLYAAFANGILPIPGMDPGRFHPDQPLLRGEAAAYIYNALHVNVREVREELEVQAEQSAPPPSDDVVYVAFPFTYDGVFHGKKPMAFRFDVRSPVVASTIASLTGLEGTLSCRLYLLGESGFSDQYFLGFEQAGNCSLLTALSPGSYQLQLQPTVADAAFSVRSGEGRGDGNDGFREAREINPGQSVEGTLESGDLADWYHISLSEKQQLMVEFSAADPVECLVYAMNNIDWFGFGSPRCNEWLSDFDFQGTGDFYIVPKRKRGAEAQSYTLQVRLQAAQQ